MSKSNVKYLLVVGFTFFVSSCAEDKPLNTFEPEGPKAQSIYDLMTPLVWVIMAIIFVLVVGGTILIALKGRVRPGEDLDDLPDQIHGNLKLEWAWTAAPAVLLAALCIPMVNSIWELEEKNEESELDVMVIGQQWWWEYRYDVNGNGFFRDANGDGKIDDLDKKLPLDISLDREDVVSATELVIPAGQQIDLTIASRDVIHSFWIPRLNGKRDAVPGRLHTWSVEADQPGKYTGWCTEFCGLSHARMRMSTVALSDADFAAWLENQSQLAEVPEDEDALAGREVFIGQCTSCHVINDGSDSDRYDDDFYENVPLDSGAAPNLTHFASRSTFAGGIYNTYVGPVGDPNDNKLDVADYLKLSEYANDPESEYRFNTPELKRWVQNASSRKDMAPDEQQGMISFESLSNDDLDAVVAYLETLK